jgi:hypothetical protein
LTLVQAEVIPFDFTGGQLSGANEVPPALTTASGGEIGFGVSYDTASRTLTLNVAYGMLGFTPLQGSFLSAGLYRAPAGEVATWPYPLRLDNLHTAYGPRAGTIIGSLQLTEADGAALLGDDIYLNIKSTAFPLGEIRAQLLPIPEPGTVALLGLGLGGMLLLRRRAG